MKLEEMTAPQLINYIKELREENRVRREAVEEYESSLGQFDEAQQRGLLHMIRTLAEAPDQGAVLFRELADNIDGSYDKTPPPPQEEEDMSTTEEEPTLAEQIQAAVIAALEAKEAENNEQRTKQEQEEYEQAVAYWDGEAKKLGYEPNSPEAADLFFMANKLGTTDLNEAHTALEQFNEFRSKFDEDDEKPAAKKEKEAEGDEEPEFPKTAGRGTGAPASEGNELDFGDRSAVRDAVFDMIDQEPEGV